MNQLQAKDDQLKAARAEIMRLRMRDFTFLA